MMIMTISTMMTTAFGVSSILDLTSSLKRVKPPCPEGKRNWLSAAIIVDDLGGVLYSFRGNFNHLEKVIHNI